MTNENFVKSLFKDRLLH
jgi:hypothetical protein